MQCFNFCKALKGCWKLAISGPNSDPKLTLSRRLCLWISSCRIWRPRGGSRWRAWGIIVDNVRLRCIGRDLGDDWRRVHWASLMAADTRSPMEEPPSKTNNCFEITSKVSFQSQSPWINKLFRSCWQDTLRIFSMFNSNYNWLSVWSNSKTVKRWRKTPNQVFLHCNYLLSCAFL